MKGMHSREELYKFLWNSRDNRNIVSMSQGEVAKQFGISYQRLSIVMSEFIDMGLVQKYKHQFLLRYDPRKIPWEDFNNLRAKYISHKNKEKNDE
jgi:DNA-binding transcriptional regulator GbsR (MarR family)